MSEEAVQRAAKAIQRSIEAHMTSTLYGTNQIANNAPQEPLTIDRLHRMMLALPPRQTWLQSQLFPNDRAIQVDGAGEIFLIAGRAFWDRLRRELRRLPPAEVTMNNPMLSFNCEPTDIDEDPQDDEERASWKRGEWKRLKEAMLVAMVELPDWLRAPK